jgi:hypothetical protein
MERLAPSVVSALAADEDKKAQRIDFEWQLPSGALAQWCSVDILDRALFDHSALPERDKLRSSYQLERGCSLKLMPDYGGASLWEPQGACSALNETDALPDCSEQELGAFDRAIEGWQDHFEWFCDVEPITSSHPPFEWGPFSSKAAALALRSRALLAHVLHVEEPWENDEARSGIEGYPREGDPIWLPEWEDETELGAEASAALESLDEKAFVKAWLQGARQPVAAPMPWALYCAHMGLAQALGVMAHTDPSSCAKLCLWGCSLWDAALFNACPLALDVAMATVGVPSEPEAESWCQRVARKRHIATPEVTANLLSKMARAGLELPSSHWLSGQRASKTLDVLIASVESIKLELSTPRAAAAGPARARSL